MLYRLCGFYCCVAPANLNLMPNFYGWPNNVLVVPLPQVGGGGSAIIEISGKEIKMKSFSCQWKLIFISLMYLTLHDNNNYDCL